jgi:hypothetical protein
MTNKEMEKLADLIVTKLLITLSHGNPVSDAVEAEFIREIIMSDNEYDITEEEMLMGELARLQTILMIYEGEDTVAGYEKAAIISQKIKRIQHKLNKI